MITSDKAVVEKLNKLIDDNLDSPSFSVDAICQAIGISRSRLHRFVKEHADLSASLYIRKRRLQKASQLLLTTDLRISEIGDLIGMTNPQNLSTYLIEEFGISPTEFRKKKHQSLPVDEPLPVSETVLKPTILAATAPTSTLPPIRPRFVRTTRRVSIGMATGMLALSCTGLYWWFQSRPVSYPAESVRNSLVILPFINLGTAESSPACEGIQDELHTSMSLLKQLKVIARSSSDQYKDTKKSIWQIGDEP